MGSARRPRRSERPGIDAVVAGELLAQLRVQAAMLMVTYEEGFDTGEPGSVGDAAITGPGPVFWAAPPR
jgi:hypothetical protein